MINGDWSDVLGGRRGAVGRVFGVVIALVTNNQDPERLHRVKLRFPWLSADHESNWARVATTMAGGDRGTYFLPEVDDEVLVAFEHGSIDHPFVIGAMWNGKDQPPESNDDGRNDMRTIKSRSGHVIRLSDRAGNESIEVIDKSGNNRIVINTAGNRITIEATGDVAVRSTSGKLSLSAVGIEIDSQAGIHIQAAQSIEMSASAQVDIKGAFVNVN